jgi:hypothetical protein
MEPLVQNLIVAALVAGSAGWLGWRLWKTVRGKKTGCGCDHCPAVKLPAAGGGAIPGPTQARERPAR